MMHLAITAMAAVLASSSAVSPAKEVHWPWCAQYTGKGGSTNCGFASWKQCQLAVSGVGGWCYENPYLLFQEPRRQRSRKS